MFPGIPGGDFGYDSGFCNDLFRPCHFSAVVPQRIARSLLSDA